MERENDNRKAIITGAVVLVIAVLIGWFLYDDQQGRINALETEAAKYLQALADEQGRSGEQLSGLETMIEQLGGELSVLQAALDAERAEKSRVEANMDEELARMKLSTAELQQELQQRQSNQVSLNDSLQQLSSEKSDLAARLAAEREAQQQLQQQITTVADDVGKKETALEGAGLAVLRLSYQLARNQQEQRQLQASIEKVNRDRKTEAEHFAELQRRLQSELNESRVEVSQLKNRMTVIKLTNEVLFASGSANIKPAGQKVLALIAESLNSYPDRQIAIEGHTDNVPVGQGSRFESNWHLSAARALSAVNFLQQQNQVDPRRLKIVGYGEHQPIASNQTATGRQQNRRIEIRVLPPEDAWAL